MSYFVWINVIVEKTMSMTGNKSIVILNISILPKKNKISKKSEYKQRGEAFLFCSKLIQIYSSSLGKLGVLQLLKMEMSEIFKILLKLLIFAKNIKTFLLSPGI